MRTRTAARRIALQALYQWDAVGEAFRDALPGFLVEWGQGREVTDFAGELVLGCREHVVEIDARLQALAQHWALERMAVIDRNILRLAAFEILYRTDIPPKVSIDEAIDLAKRFSTEGSGAFVNGILDPLMAEVGAAEAPPAPEPSRDDS